MANKKQAAKVNHYPYFAPRIWHGMSTSVWFRLIREHGFRVQGRFPMVGWVALCGSITSVLNRIQRRRFEQRALDTPLVADPIFIIGHWRTGTTFLHSLFSHDPALWTPTCFECFSPGHFLFSRPFVTRVLKFPTKRPMDNVQLDWDKPQEDELALCVAGAPSLYRNIAFPRHETRYLESLTLEGLSPEELSLWKSTLQQFVAYLNFGRQKQLVLKSPTHTARIPTLLELYPNAKFVHITRHPKKFIPSTIHLWNAMNQTSGFQKNVADVDMEDYTFDCFHRMYESFNRNRSLIRDENYTEIAFDELVADPVASLGGVYQRLGIPGFSVAQPKFAQFAESRRNYKKNKLEVSEQLAARIAEECADYIQTYCDHTSARQAA